MKKVVFLLSDALRYDYIERHSMSFLQQIIESRNCFYVERVVPSTGFCEIAEYVLGKDALESGMLTQITAQCKWANIKRKRSLDAIDFLRRKNVLRRIPKIRGLWHLAFDRILDKYLRTVLPAEIVNVRYNIPLGLLPFLRTTESAFEYDSYHFGGANNIFIWMKNKGITYDTDDFVRHNKIVGSDTDRLSRLKKKIIRHNLADFSLLYIGYGEQGHFFGTNSKRLGTALRDYSNDIREIYNLLGENYPNSQLIIIGDHGMIDVDNYIDICSIIDRVARDMKLTYMWDYMYFIDSTLVRIWLHRENQICTFEEEIRKRISPYLECDQPSQKYLDAFKPTYGNIILLLKPGNVFYPDFFNTVRVKGMHGYLSSYKQQQGTLISFGEGVEPNRRETMKLSDVKSYLKTLYGQQ